MIGIISATKDELSLLLKNISEQELISTSSGEIVKGNLLQTPLLIAISGVGIKRARNCTRNLIQQFNPEFIVSAGFAGALNPKLNVGDLVVADWVTSLKLNKTIRLANKLPYIATNYTSGGLLTENSFINSREKKLDLFIESSANIVDMETWGIAETAMEKNVNLISVKAVSDTTSSVLPRMEKIYDHDSNIDYKKSANYFKSNPSVFLNFIKFRFIDMRKARIRLNSFLEVLIPVLNEKMKL